MQSIRKAVSARLDAQMKHLPVQIIDKLSKLPFLAKYKKRFGYWKLAAFVTQTDFATLDVSNYPICFIQSGNWDYPLFNMCFAQDMISRSLVCLMHKTRPILMFEQNIDGKRVNLWEQLLLQPYDNIPILNTAQRQIDFENECPFVWESVPSSVETMLHTRIYDTFFRFNNEVSNYIEREYEQLLAGKRTLGVLCRGTDYVKNRPRWHPIQPEVSEIIAEAKVKMQELSCEYLYLATEEKKIEDEFRAIFGDRILTNKRMYYDAFYTLGNDARISGVHFERENDTYLKSLEYFSSIVLLSRCVALIGGNCGGSRMAQCLNHGSYEYVNLFPLGLYGVDDGCVS